MKEIKLTQGYSAIVDDDDFKILSDTKWAVSRNLKANLQYAISHGKGRILMHRRIMNAPDGMVVDHVNHDGLDNRRVNLRVCSGNQNKMNRRKVSRSQSSMFKGVWKREDREKWRSRIRINNKSFNVGEFSSEIEAAKAYDIAAVKLFGAFAVTNFYAPNGMNSIKKRVK